ncbi:MAG: hypothetical protein HUU37_04180 [Bdellovibrionales bacterium]|nr:hypothetical protein [Bdellovibrionales bacterium]
MDKSLALRGLAAFLLGAYRADREEEVVLYRLIVTKMARLLRDRYRSRLSTVYFNMGRLPGPEDRRLEAPGIPAIYFEDLALRKVPANRIQSEYYLPDGLHINRAGHALLVTDGLFPDVRRGIR